MNDEITFTFEGCARCHGEGHQDLLFQKFLHPIEVGAYTFTHWAICPVTNEPILLTTEAPKEED